MVSAVVEASSDKPAASAETKSNAAMMHSKTAPEGGEVKGSFHFFEERQQQGILATQPKKHPGQVVHSPTLSRVDLHPYSAKKFMQIYI